VCEKGWCSVYNLVVLPIQQQLSKWFYDTSTSTATRAARCSLFVGEGLVLLGVSYRGTQWRRGFTWFGPTERNTLRPQENRCVVLLSAV
jgi:hypothetical protein